MSRLRRIENVSVGFKAANDRGVATETLASSVAELGNLDDAALRRRWRALVGGSVPPTLGRPLILRILAYKLQAQQLGDLDKASLRELSRLAGRQQAHVGPVPTFEPPCSRVDERRAKSALPPRPDPLRVARPGTLLTREYGGVLHRVTVLDEGVSWSGRTYDSLSKVALAITGTRWNGPRFFGLRDPASNRDQRSTPRSDGKKAAIVRGRRPGWKERSVPERAPS